MALSKRAGVARTLGALDVNSVKLSALDVNTGCAGQRPTEQAQRPPPRLPPCTAGGGGGGGV